MIKSDDISLGVLNTLIIVNSDAQQGYETAAADVRDPELARVLGELGAQRMKFVDELTARVRTLRAETVADATRVQARGPDRVLLRETCFGLGFMLPPSLVPGCGPRSFGHGGAGGSVAFADPDARLAFAYVMNDLRFDPAGDPRSETLVQAVYRALG